MLLTKFKNDISPCCELLFALVAAALWFMQGGAIGWVGPWPLFLLGAMWALYWIRTGLKHQLTSVDILLALFVFSAWVGTYTAYAPESAWLKFWLVVGAWGLFYAVVHQPDLQHRYAALAVFGLFGFALTSYYFMTNDFWVTHPIKIRSLVVLGEAISARLPRLSMQGFNPNVVGGLLAMVLPFDVALIALTRKDAEIDPIPSRSRLWLRIFWCLVAGCTGLGLLVTTSRGAWIALLNGFTLWLLWRGIGRWCRRYPDTHAWTRRLRIMAVVLCLFLVAGIVFVALIIANGWYGSADLIHHFNLLIDALPLARDVAFTGIGLGTYMMNLSIYSLLIHVGFINSSHNFFMDLLIEQGILGLATYLGFIIVAMIAGIRRLRQASSASLWQIEAGLVSLAVIHIHGQVDYILYGSRGLLLLFVPMSIILMGKKVQALAPGPSPSGSRRSIYVTAAILCIALILIGFTWPSLLAAFSASLGSVAQAQIELTSYDPERFDERSIDMVRREENLGAAIHRFEQALTWDPKNLTSLRRLASIDLSRGAYDSALTHMTVAWNAGHRDAVTRLLYGDALVAAGRIEQAADVIKGLAWAESRLDGQAWSRYWVHEDWARAAYTWRTLELLNPDNGTAPQYAEAAEMRMHQQP